MKLCNRNVLTEVILRRDQMKHKGA
ncbi:unnamed protein product [Tetraodon nigroviridis]|uniref:(spotted green pufferfish) hypothetical protein n=1 Tax=Tetraodon nigroviridis TaxID=99883 RepID=Q4SRG6_TETNG|nr:unnamed protein product [Tetraodon nigroviridis]